MTPLRAAVCSWSGGKDSCLALHRAADEGIEPRVLATMLIETGARTRSHGLPVDVVEAQAAALGLELIARPATWASYTDVFTETLRGLHAAGIELAVFGDIDLDEHRDWCLGVCGDSGLTAVHPLWRTPHDDLVDELLELGYEAVLVAARDGVVPRSLLGRTFDRRLLDDLASLGVDVSGEGGEFHTVVVDGPLFARRIELRAGETVLRDGVWFLDVRHRPTI